MNYWVISWKNSILLKLGWLLIKKTCHNHAATAADTYPEHENFDAFLSVSFLLQCMFSPLFSMQKVNLGSACHSFSVSSPQWLHTSHGFFFTALRRRAVTLSIKHWDSPATITAQEWRPDAWEWASAFILPWLYSVKSHPSLCSESVFYASRPGCLLALDIAF